MPEDNIVDVLKSLVASGWELLKTVIIFITIAIFIFVIGVWLFLRWLFSGANFTNGVIKPSSKDYMRMGVVSLQNDLGINVIKYIV